MPILGVPFFADQLAYAEKTEKLKLGRRLNLVNITEETFYETLIDVINNPRYLVMFILLPCRNNIVFNVEIHRNKKKRLISHAE